VIIFNYWSAASYIADVRDRLDRIDGQLSAYFMDIAR
jgi:hypothetical protein